MRFTRFFFALFLTTLFLPQAFALIEGNHALVINNYEQSRTANQLVTRSAEKIIEKKEKGRCHSNFVTGESAFGKSGVSLSLDYDFETPGASCFFSVPLVRETLNLPEMSYLSFWVKTEQKDSKPQLIVELREDLDGDGKYFPGKDRVSRISASGFTGKAGEDGWKKVVIPFSEFQKIEKWNRVIEICFILQSKLQKGKATMLLDDLVFGSHYPEGLTRREISMQNRVSSFKIGTSRVTPKVKLKRKPTFLTLTLTFIDPYLEEVRFEESRDGGNEWRRIESFYDQTTGGIYRYPWELEKEFHSKKEVLIRAVGIDLFGGEAELAGPYRLYID